MRDLLAGETVQAWSLRLAETINLADAKQPDDWDGPSFVRGLWAIGKSIIDNGPGGDHHRVQFAATGAPLHTRSEIIESLRGQIPAELVEDVLIGGRSWSEP